MRICRQGPSLVVHTPAKLNLFLEVLGRRPDGYHELETVMVSVGLYDTLLLSEDESQQTRLRCHWTARNSQLQRSSQGEHQLLHGSADGGAGGASDFEQNNLILRAADLLREQTGCRRGVTVNLYKRIPLQAGLGGGSSDAAATLVGLNHLWQLGLTAADLHRLAAQLGSDVNFFLDSSLAAVCTGRGEQIHPVVVGSRLHFVVVTPPTGLSTAEVFRQWQPGAGATRSLADVTAVLASGRMASVPGVLHNGLESPAQELNPDVAATLEALRAAGATTAMMSGSGSSCFAICRSAAHARRIAGRMTHLELGQTFAVTLQA